MEALSSDRILYPDSDGKPLADNTAQLHWIVMLKENLEALLPVDFVAGDLLWYPVVGEVALRAAPDVMVALGRPKGGRGSYKQWEEAGVAPQVVFEVLSPGNSPDEMKDKHSFYDRYGVQEYYVIDPTLDDPAQAILEVWCRRQAQLRLAPFDGRYKSPLLGVTFARDDGRLTLERPDGQPFRSLAEIMVERDAAVRRAQRLAERLRALGLDPDEVAGDEG